MTITIVQPVILCGGSGTRLWPLSREGFPKQFLCLTGSESLFQQAARRLMALDDDTIRLCPPLFVSNEEHRFLAVEQLRETGIELGAALLEPVARNTAPALTLAAMAAIEGGNDPILVVTPSDQTVLDQVSFNEAMHSAIREAGQGSIVILGITPDHPATGFGYIQVETRLDTPPKSVLAVRQFVEKPDLATAQTYLDSGSHYWNSGIFVMRASVWLKVLQTFRKDISRATEAAWAAKTKDSVFVRPDKELFAKVPSDSVDYAVLEPLTTQSSDFVHQHSLKMVSLDAGWNDLGAWDAVWNVLPKDENGNAYFGDVKINQSCNSLVHASSRLVSLVGVDSLVVIETPDAVLVADKSRSQDVKHIVNLLKQQKREELSFHRKVHRPWGWYDNIDLGHHFKVKRIHVKPNASLSLQMHRHRSEHWIVVKGTAEITNGEKTILLTENQSTYIPIGITHRLANPGKIPLEIIEVQCGNYLGEDDIVRFADNYGRSK